MNSKSWQVFDGKIRSLKRHQQLSDLALTNANKLAKKHIGKKKNIATALGGKLHTHSQLNVPNTTTDIGREFITSRNKLNEQVIVELYRIFSDYLFNIIKEIEHKQPKRMLSLLSNKKDREIAYDKIIALGEYDALIDEMARRVFRSLENKRSTKDMLNSLIKTTNISISTTLINDALLFFEIRHLIIHNNCKADEKFINMLNKDIIKVRKVNDKISLNYRTTNKGLNTVFKLCKTLDDQLVGKGLVNAIVSP